MDSISKRVDAFKSRDVIPPVPTFHPPITIQPKRRILELTVKPDDHAHLRPSIAEAPE